MPDLVCDRLDRSRLGAGGPRPGGQRILSPRASISATTASIPRWSMIFMPLVLRRSLTWRPREGTQYRLVWRFGSQRRLVWRWEWETELP